jgi:hypothetical protein
LAGFHQRRSWWGVGFAAGPDFDVLEPDVLQALEYLDPDVAFERRRSELLRVPVAHGIPDP